MIVEAILALATLASTSDAPRLIKPFNSLEACILKADKRNRSDETLRTPDARATGAEVVCLYVIRAGRA